MDDLDISLVTAARVQPQTVCKKMDGDVFQRTLLWTLNSLFSHITKCQHSFHSFSVTLLHKIHSRSQATQEQVIG